MDIEDLNKLVESGDADALVKALSALDSPEHADLKAAFSRLATAHVNALLTELEPWAALCDIPSTVLTWLEEQGFDAELDEDGDIVMTLPVGDRELSASFLVLPELSQIVFYTDLIEDIEPVLHPFVGDFLHRANSNLILGNFEMDMDTGEVRFRVAADWEGQAITSKLLHNFVSATIQTLEHYLDGLVGILEGRMTSAEFFSEADAD